MSSSFNAFSQQMTDSNVKKLMLLVMDAIPKVIQVSSKIEIA